MKGSCMMIVKKQDSKMDIDLENTREYYQAHSLCDCPCCRNLYVQIKSAFPLLSEFLSDLGVDISRPDEAGSCEMENEIDYVFVSYTVCGKILEYNEYEIDIKDNLFLSIIIGDSFIPNEQKNDYFVVTVYGIRLPWVLDEPFPETTPITPTKNGLLYKLKARFQKNTRS